MSEFLIFLGILAILITISFIFASLVVMLMDEINHIRKVKREYGIVWSPLKIGFLTYAYSFGILKKITFFEYVMFSVGSFIVQFFLPRYKKEEKIGMRSDEIRFQKLHQKYKKR